MKKGNTPAGTGPHPGDDVRLLHELGVQRVEIEAQNEELKRTREDMEAALTSYTELFDFAPLGYVTIGADRRIVEANHAAARVLGKPRADLAGSAFESFVRPSDRPVCSSLVARALQSTERQDDEVELLPKGERRLFVRLTATLLPHREAKILLGVEDVTGRKDREEKLHRTELALRESDRRKDEFIAVLSHELRNPLAPIRTALYVLHRADPGSAQAGRALETIDRQVTHLTRLVDDLLDVTRIARGKILLQKERVELSELVSRTIDDHRASFVAAGVELEQRFEPGRFWVDVDPTRLIQAVSNVIGNALKFTPAGGCVVVRLERLGDRVQIVVEDSGVGIDRDVLQSLFEPFAQGPQAMDRSHGGLGLGLAMVKGLIELHGGMVQLHSEGLHRGSTLRLTLPLANGDGSRRDVPQVVVPHRRRVLVIEDNQDAADTLSEALSMNGHEVAVAYDGITGLAKAQTFHPDIVICDIGLPVMDGFAVARAFHDLPGRTPFLVALSGYAQPEDQARARAAGFDRHVAKPPSLETLDRLFEEMPSEDGAPHFLH